VKEWVYESRRNFQIILPFLYLGPFTAAKNVAALAKAGITMVLVVRDSMSAQSGFLSGKKAAETLGIHHAAVDVDGNAELINFGFTKATRLINEHLLMKFRELAPPDTPRDKTPGTWGKVLVFCESGNERSAAVIVAYLMAMYGIDLVASIQYVQTQRFCIAFDDNLKTLLLNYQQILEARRGVLGAQDSNLPSANPARPALVKRRIDDVDKEDYDMLSGEGDPDDVARFESRKPFAPFYDVE
jgi:serine/threonine/tyrosine-interacting protein